MVKSYGPNPKEEYAKEEINFETVDFKDNQQCLDLLTKRPTGLIHILNDESNFPKVWMQIYTHTLLESALTILLPIIFLIFTPLVQATDVSFLEKAHAQHEGHPYYIRPKTRVNKFGIKHYAGEVFYEVGERKGKVVC